MTNDEIKKARRDYNIQRHRHKDGTRLDKIGNVIEFRITFDEWMQIWLESGHWHERGIRRGQYVMSRYNDIGHYEVGNVFIQTCGENIKAAHTGKVNSPETRARMKLAQNRPEIRQRKSEALLGRKHSPETIEKRRKSLTGIKHTPQSIENMRAAQRRVVTCPHCGKQGVRRIMMRWHFDRCTYHIKAASV